VAHMYLTDALAATNDAVTSFLMANSLLMV
jgi:hypothetical protein